MHSASHPSRPRLLRSAPRAPSSSVRCAPYALVPCWIPRALAPRASRPFTPCAARPACPHPLRSASAPEPNPSHPALLAPMRCPLTPSSLARCAPSLPAERAPLPFVPAGCTPRALRATTRASLVPCASRASDPRPAAPLIPCTACPRSAPSASLPFPTRRAPPPPSRAPRVPRLLRGAPRPRAASLAPLALDTRRIREGCATDARKPHGGDARARRQNRVGSRRLSAGRTPCPR